MKSRLITMLLAVSAVLLTSCRALPELIFIKNDDWKFQATFFTDGTCEFSVNGIQADATTEYTRKQVSAYSVVSPPVSWNAETCKSSDYSSSTLWVESVEKDNVFGRLASTFDNANINSKGDSGVTISFPIFAESGRTEKQKKEFSEDQKDGIGIRASILQVDYLHHNIRPLNGNMLFAWCGYSLVAVSGQATFYGQSDQNSTGIEYLLSGKMKRRPSGC